MINNSPFNASSMSQVTPCQNVPAQTNLNNSFQQQPNVAQPMQTSPCVPHFTAQQGLYGPGTFKPGCQLFAPPPPPSCAGPNPWPGTTLGKELSLESGQSAGGNCRILTDNVVEQIRSCVAGTSPIFILPGACYHQQQQQQQHQPPPPGPWPSPGGSGSFSTIPTVCYPPSFVPYPLAVPVYDHQESRRSVRCRCSRNRGNHRGIEPIGAECCEEHVCSQPDDETICSRKSCPASLNLQALASQLLSLQGVVACAATRLVLRWVPGSNVTTPTEETVERSKRALNGLTRDQLLAESRNAQQVNALINLHLTANPPTSVLPVLTAVQLKVNLLKTQVESLLNRKLMESQGVGVESTATIEPMVLALKTDDELRGFLGALRRKECEERVNLSFAPYQSQRVIAETRLNNVQSKISQVEAELERRRVTRLPRTDPQTYQPFAENGWTTGSARDDLGYANSPNRESPDPFAVRVSSPRRLNLRPHVGSPATTYDKPENASGTNAASCSDKASGPEGRTVACGRDDGRARSSSENCSCDDRTSSDESDCEAKKKLRLRLDEAGILSVTSACRGPVTLMRFASSVEIESSENSTRDTKVLDDSKDERRETSEPGSSRAIATIKEEAVEDKGRKVREIPVESEDKAEKEELVGTSGPESKDKAEIKEQESIDGTGIASESRDNTAEEEREHVEELPSRLQPEEREDVLKNETIDVKEIKDESPEELQDPVCCGDAEDGTVSDHENATKENQSLFRSSVVIFLARPSSEIESELQGTSPSDDQINRKRYTESNRSGDKSRTDNATIVGKIEDGDPSNARRRCKKSTDVTRNNRNGGYKLDSSRKVPHKRTVN